MTILRLATFSLTTPHLTPIPLPIPLTPYTYPSISLSLYTFHSHAHASILHIHILLNSRLMLSMHHFSSPSKVFTAPILPYPWPYSQLNPCILSLTTSLHLCVHAWVQYPLLEWEVQWIAWKVWSGRAILKLVENIESVVKLEDMEIDSDVPPASRLKILVRM